MDIYPLLDRMREEQLRQTGLLLDVIERQDESLRLLRTIGKLLRDKPKGKGISLPQGSVTVGIQYLGVAAALIYMLKGGDLGQAMALLKGLALF